MINLEPNDLVGGSRRDEREKRERERYLETFRKDDVSFVMPKMVG